MSMWGAPVPGGSPPPFASLPPFCTARPVHAAQVRVGDVLSLIGGMWAGTPVISYAYQWLRDGVAIGGATAATYTLVAGDLSRRIRCRITASNATGAGNAVETQATNPVQDILRAPVTVVAPIIQGTPQVGRALAISDGQFLGGPIVRRRFQWLRDGAPIAGAVNGTRTAVEADEGAMLIGRQWVTGADGVELQIDTAAVGPIAESDGEVEPEPEPVTTVTVVIMGQSEFNYMLNNTSSWSSIPMPTPGNNNLVLFLQLGPAGSPVQRVDVNPTTAVTNGAVNPAMANISAFLAFMRPTTTFALGDGAVGGTGRADLADDSTDLTEPNQRLWSDFTNVVNAMETEFGPTQYLVECWYNSDRGRINNFGPAFSPFYFGCTVDGSNFTLGTVHGPIGDRQIDHCLWDYSAPANTKGRGIFRRDTTKWMVNTAMRFDSAPVAPAAEWENFSNGTPIEPSRQVVMDFAANPMAASVGMQVGPSMHIAQWQADRIHPAQNEVDGLILFSWPIAFNLLRAAGQTVHEPTIVDIEGPTDGSYADLVVSLPNGGNLGTLSTIESRSAYAGASPHHQPVVGVEIARGATRRPVYKTDETDYPADFRGTVTITDTGSGSPRRGRVRVTPSTPFAFGDRLSYLRGQASATCLYPRDDGLHPYMLMEHVPAWVDPTALYKCPGIAVRPYQEDLVTPVAAPPFVARGARFDGSSYYSSTAISQPGGTRVLASVWMRQSVWTTPGVLLEQRVGTTARLGFNCQTGRRIQFLLHQTSGSNLFTTATNSMVEDGWNHLLMSYDHALARLQVWANGVEQDTSGYTFGAASAFDATLTRIGVGCAVGGTSVFTGDMAHLYYNVGASLDLSVQANREKFVLGGQPVDLGPTGALPTGAPPQWYYDGEGPNLINRGTAGAVPLVGALTASPAPLPGY